MNSNKRVLRALTVIVVVCWLAFFALMAACATPVRLVGECRAHQAGTVRFNDHNCPTALCQPVDGGFAWLEVPEDACQ